MSGSLRDRTGDSKRLPRLGSTWVRALLNRGAGETERRHFVSDRSVRTCAPHKWHTRLSSNHVPCCVENAQCVIGASCACHKQKTDPPGSPPYKCPVIGPIRWGAKAVVKWIPFLRIAQQWGFGADGWQCRGQSGAQNINQLNQANVALPFSHHLAPLMTAAWSSCLFGRVWGKPKKHETAAPNNSGKDLPRPMVFGRELKSSDRAPARRSQ